MKKLRITSAAIMLAIVLCASKCGKDQPENTEPPVEETSNETNNNGSQSDVNTSPSTDVNTKPDDLTNNEEKNKDTNDSNESNKENKESINPEHKK